MAVSNQLDLEKVKYLRRAQRGLSGWATEGGQMSGGDLKDIVEALERKGYLEAHDVPRSFILAQGASGAVELQDGSETYLYWR